MDGARRAGAGSTGRRAATLIAPIAALALLLGGCGEDDSGATTAATTTPEATLRVEVSPPRAPAGETVQARVVNDTTQTFTYGLDYSLERREGDSFVEAGGPRIVPEIGLIAEPGATGPPVRVRIPADAEPGEYRIVIQRGVPDVGVLSGELTVTAGD